MLAAMRPTDPRYAANALADAPSIDASVNFIAMCWAVLDPLARYKMVTTNGNDRLVDAHHAFWPDEAAMDEGSPQRILERGEDARLPPALLIQGMSDDNLTPDMADRFAAAYQAAGGFIQLEKFEGAPHAFIAKGPDAKIAKQAIQLIVDFVNEQTA